MGEKKRKTRVCGERKEETSNNDAVIPEYEVWKPDRMNPVLSTMDNDERKTFYLYRNVTSILNKLTPENFDKLMEKMKSLLIDSSSRMQGVVDIIHKKAINEWKFCGLYAKICHHMKNRTVKNEDGSITSFATLVTRQCEKYFENSLEASCEFDERKARIDSFPNLELKKRLLEEFEWDEYLSRKAAVGNCRFMGELFKLNEIQAQIILRMLDTFVERAKISDLECLCTLVTVIGEFYEKNFGNFPEQYFENISILSKCDELPTRIRFALLNIIDLKNNSWSLRFLPQLPKTFKEIENEMCEGKMFAKMTLRERNKKPRKKK